MKKRFGRSKYWVDAYPVPRHQRSVARKRQPRYAVWLEDHDTYVGETGPVTSLKEAHRFYHREAEDLAYEMRSASAHVVKIVD